MKKIRLIIAIAALLSAFEQKAAAQFYFFDKDHYDTHLIYEIGGSIGMMNCLTDIGGNKGKGKPFIKDLNIGNNNLNGSIFLSALYKYAIGLRLEATFGRVSAHDSILKNVKETTSGRYERNLMFRSKINEISLVAEFHIRFILRSFLFEDDLNMDDEPPRLSPYISSGVGYFSYSPQALLRNNWVDLQPLSTEGQGFVEYPNRKPYKLKQINIPLGVGLKYELSPSFNVRLEFLHRFLSTDYLDDVSTRYINADLFQRNLIGARKILNALELSRNDRVNPGGPTGEYNKTEGGIRGNPKDKDAYFSFNLKVGLSIGRELIKRSGPQRF